MGPSGFPDLLIFLTVLSVGYGIVLDWPAARICGRIGFSPWLGLLIVIPIASLFLLWFVAFSRWPGPPFSQRSA